MHSKRLSCWKQALHQRTGKCPVYKFFYTRLASLGLQGFITDTEMVKHTRFCI